MAAKKKPVQTWSLADLGVDAAEVGLAAAWSAVDAVTARPPRQAGQIVTDEGDGGAQARRVPRRRQARLTAVDDASSKEHAVSQSSSSSTTSRGPSARPPPSC